MKFILYIIPFILLCIGNTQAQSISSTGNWTVNIPDNYKVKEAGMDYANGVNVESSTNQTFINTQFVLFQPSRWRVTVSSSNIPNNFTISCRRTGNGTPPTGLSQIYDGQSYLTISPVQQYFFRGRYSYRNIPIQYKLNLSNLSVTMPVKTYTINITYTITGGW